MPGKTKQAKGADEASSIFVPREKLGLRFSLKPPTDEQKQVLSEGRIFLWPKSYEMKNTEAVKEVLRAIDVAWGDKK